MIDHVSLSLTIVLGGVEVKDWVRLKDGIIRIEESNIKKGKMENPTTKHL